MGIYFQYFVLSSTAIMNNLIHVNTYASIFLEKTPGSRILKFDKYCQITLTNKQLYRCTLSPAMCGSIANTAHEQTFISLLICLFLKRSILMQFISSTVKNIYHNLIYLRLTHIIISSIFYIFFMRLLGFFLLICRSHLLIRKLVYGL